MSKESAGQCVDQCVPFWMTFFGYSCDGCPTPPSPPIARTAPVAAPVGAPVGAPAGAPVAVPVAAPNAAPTTASLMTMWTTSPESVKGGSCEYAQSASTAQGSSWLVPYVNKQRYCAVSDALYQSGLGCGKCYQITFNGVGGTDPGRAGSSVIQVVDSGSSKEFDCFINAFTEITGATTGVFPIQYAQVNCTKTGPTVVILDGNNSYYVKALFAGGKTGVQSAKLQIGSTTYTMDRVSGATWKANLTGQTNQAVAFFVTYTDGTTDTISKCFGGVWPVATSSQCSL